MRLKHLANWKRLSIGFLKDKIDSRKRQLEDLQATFGRGYQVSERDELINQDLTIRRELDELLEREEL